MSSVFALGSKRTIMIVSDRSPARLVRAVEHGGVGIVLGHDVTAVGADDQPVLRLVLGGAHEVDVLALDLVELPRLPPDEGDGREAAHDREDAEREDHPLPPGPPVDRVAVVVVGAEKRSRSAET